MVWRFGKHKKHTWTGKLALLFIVGFLIAGNFSRPHYPQLWNGVSELPTWKGCCEDDGSHEALSQFPAGGRHSVNVSRVRRISAEHCGEPGRASWMAAPAGSPHLTSVNAEAVKFRGSHAGTWLPRFFSRYQIDKNLYVYLMFLPLSGSPLYLMTSAEWTEVSKSHRLSIKWASLPSITLIRNWMKP